MVSAEAITKEANTYLGASLDRDGRPDDNGALQDRQLSTMRTMEEYENPSL